MTVILTAYHGTSPGAPLIGGQDPVSGKTLSCLWVSNSYYLAAQFQDGEVRKLSIRLAKPLVLTEDDRAERFPGASHATIAALIQEAVSQGRLDHDAVVFLDTVDGMEAGDVAAIFPRKAGDGPPGLDHAVRYLGRRFYDGQRWISGPGFGTEPLSTLPARSTWSGAFCAVSRTDSALLLPA